MSIQTSDVVPFSQARATLSDLAEQVKAGAEKIITKNGESYVALIDAKRLDYYHQLERERIHLLLIDEASKGLDDVAAGRTEPAREALLKIKRRLTARSTAGAAAAPRPASRRGSRAVSRPVGRPANRVASSGS